MIRKIIKALWIFLAVIVLAIVVIFVSISKGWIGYMPPVEELENPSYKFATEIFSEDEKVLGTWSYSKENRVSTTPRHRPTSRRLTFISSTASGRCSNLHYHSIMTTAKKERKQ